MLGSRYERRVGEAGGDGHDWTGRRENEVRNRSGRDPAIGYARWEVNNYWVEGIAAGSFKIVVENRSGGALGEALVFNFAMVKAVAA